MVKLLTFAYVCDAYLRITTFTGLPVGTILTFYRMYHRCCHLPLTVFPVVVVVMGGGLNRLTTIGSHHWTPVRSAC